MPVRTVKDGLILKQLEILSNAGSKNWLHYVTLIPVVNRL